MKEKTSVVGQKVALTAMLTPGWREHGEFAVVQLWLQVPSKIGAELFKGDR